MQELFDMIGEILTGAFGVASRLEIVYKACMQTLVMVMVKG